MEDVLQILREQQKSVFSHHGISVVNVVSEEDGNSLVLQILQTIINKQTILYLSGGRTPRELYKLMAKEEVISPGAFALVDERYGEPLHENSNEKMLYDAGLIRYATMANIHVYLALQKGKSREETADKYDDQVRTLLAQYRKHIAILGVGMDGHTAGIPSQNSKLKTQNSKIDTFPAWINDLYERAKNRMVIDYDDQGGFYGERITMTFQGLSMMDLLIVLVFGKDKKPALELMFSDGTEPVRQAQGEPIRDLTQGEEEVPSRFYKRPEIARKTLVITDQEVA